MQLVIGKLSALIQKGFNTLPGIKKANLFSYTFLEVVLYICPYREIEQELNLKQSCIVLTGV
ncbi:hypothetical protein BWG23_10755 [Flavobacterium oreochromis]|nr:hypothetical protein BWG23_10755 [Flavobacterium oreochromis]